MPLAPLAGFDARKAAQVVAFFVSKQPDIEKLKLIKLVYLSERAALARYGRPMLYDELYSLKDGPICSSTLNGINGEIETFSEYVKMDDNRRNIHAVQLVDRDALDEVSDAEIEVLEAVWDEFSNYSASDIRRWTHDNCPEYTEVTQGRVPIRYSEVLDALGSGDQAERIENDVSLVRRASGYLLA